MKILYSFNKTGFEAEYWQREITAAGDDTVSFVCFNHEPYVSTSQYLRAQTLDHLYYANHPGLARMYADLEAMILKEKPDVLLVDNLPPYHPDWLRKLDVYKVLRVCDGPVTAYDRDFAFAHAYDHVLYHTKAYSRDLTMPEKLDYVGARRASFWPLAHFAAMGVGGDENAVFAAHRPNDVVFVGAIYPEKMPLLAAIRREYGRRFRIFGVTNLKKNIYFNAVHGARVWVRPLPFEQYGGLYRSCKIGINAHLRGKYTVGNYRLYDLPANGVCQLSDGGEFLGDFFNPGTEILPYERNEEVLALIESHLARPQDSEEIARSAYRRVMRDHRIDTRLKQLADILPVKRGSAQAPS